MLAGSLLTSRQVPPGISANSSQQGFQFDVFENFLFSANMLALYLKIIIFKTLKQPPVRLLTSVGLSCRFLDVEEVNNNFPQILTIRLLDCHV